MSTLEFAFLFYHYREKFKKELEDFMDMANERYFVPPGEIICRSGHNIITGTIQEGWYTDNEDQILKGLKMAYVWADAEKHRLDVKTAIKEIQAGIV